MLFEKLRELWSPREVITDDILIGYVASDRVCPRYEGIMLGVTHNKHMQKSISWERKKRYLKLKYTPSKGAYGE
jgi:hypothetical protein